MPPYEIALTMRNMARPEMATALKRVLTKVYENRGIVFSIENLGTRGIPVVMYDKVVQHRRAYEGSFFSIKVETPIPVVPILLDEYTRDMDIFAHAIRRTDKQEDYVCQIEEEWKPPAYREDVKALIEVGKKKERKFHYNTGFDYEAFKM